MFALSVWGSSHSANTRMLGELEIPNWTRMICKRFRSCLGERMVKYPTCSHKCFECSVKLFKCHVKKMSLYLTINYYILNCLMFMSFLV